jgi:hypothetical protein
MKEVKLSETCIFLQLSLARMGDKRGVSSDEIEVDADKDLVKVRKVIFKSASFDAIKSLDSEIRRYVRSQCFPYDAGLHLAALKMEPIITERLTNYLNRRVALVDTFAVVFPTLGQVAKDHLRKLHREEDYDFDDIRDQFSMGWQYLMLTTPTSMESINSERFKQEQRKMQARWSEALDDARLLLRETCLNLVSHLRTSLESDAYGAPKRLATSTVRNLQEFFENFNLRDITNDTELSQLVESGKRLVTGIDAESLRTMDGLRLRVKSELNEIEQAVTSTLMVAPTRRIKVRS